MNKKSLITILLTILMNMVGTKAFAQEISVENDGVTIHYRYINDGKELEVIKGKNYYVGNIVIPEEVTYSNVRYKVTSIAPSAFERSEVTSVTIGNGVTSIGSRAFYSCWTLTSITIGNSVTSIGESAFYDCSSLASITIPNSVTSIGHLAFGCSGLTSVIIGKGVTSINGSSVFYRCSNLNFIEFHCKTISGFSNFEFNLGGVIIGDEVTSISDEAFGSCRGLTYVSIGNGVISIGNNAFSHNQRLTSVTIGSGVKSIGESAFSTTGLSSVIIPDGVTSIGDFAFENCYKLTSVIIPNSVTSIGSSVFENCNNLTSANIGNGVTYIGDRAFFNCSENLVVNLFVSNLVVLCQNNIIPSIKKTVKLFDSDGKEIKDLIIPNEVTSINDYAFYHCIGLSSVTISNKVKSIGKYAFNGCSGLVSVIFGSSVNSIDYEAFGDTDIVKTIWLSSSRPSGPDVFGAINYVSNDKFDIKNRFVYPSLSSIFVVDGIKYVPISITERTCAAIDCVYDESTENINIGETVVFKGVSFTVKSVNKYACYNNEYIKDLILSFRGDIDEEAFGGCSNINRADINIYGNISRYSFYYCTNLKKVTTGNGVSTIGECAFSNCNNLESFTFGTGVTSIEGNAFSYCTDVMELYCGSATPPYCKSQALDDINKWDCKLYVPSGSLSAYKAASQWKEFFFQEESALSTQGGPKCSKPLISLVDGKFVFSCDTPDVNYSWSISTPKGTNGSDNNVSSVTLKVFATKLGYQNSEAAFYEVSGLVGDLDGNGKVDVADHVELSKIIMNKYIQSH